MIHIQSTWFPLIDRNPQEYLDNIFQADEADFVKATHSVYHNGMNATCLRFAVGVGGIPDRRNEDALSNGKDEQSTEAV